MAAREMAPVATFMKNTLFLELLPSVLITPFQNNWLVEETRRG
jgi:hypothetical protein